MAAGSAQATLAPEPTTPARPRLDTVDLLRGLVMVIMALDHTRDWFTNAFFDPTDLSRTWPALYFTRFITHFCAPTFVFLAGAGAYLYGARGRSPREISRFLLTRGIWLVILEHTVVRFGWFMNFDYTFTFCQVIWAIGWSMVALSGLVFLPLRWVAGIGIAIVALHNTLDGIRSAAFGAWAPLWIFLHEQNIIKLTDRHVMLVAYPVLAWIGVIACGYGFGAVLRMEPQRRSRMLVRIGAAMIVAFLVLRGFNVYGDPRPWSVQKDGLFTFMSFLNTTKYPPSLLFTLMTLGPAILLLGVVRDVPRFLKPLVVFGRVPMFYYVAHQFAIHLLAFIVQWTLFRNPWWLFQNSQILEGAPKGQGFGLPGVYLAWIVIVVSLYPLCKWFAGVKQRRNDAWLSYV